MDFRILGPLEVLEGPRRVPLGGTKRRAVLALLLLHPNEMLGSERMVDELWGERPPATAMKSLQVHVSRLRKSLAADAAETLATRGHGYVLELDPDQVDAHRFERLLDAGRNELAAERPERALELLEQALALWRGPALADLAYEPFAQAEIARLDDLRLVALEHSIEAKLALARHGELVGQLEGLIAENPYRERLRAQLMLALYRSDRQADALQAYQDARRTLVEELGIEPGERLRELERAVLDQSPGLGLPVPAAPPAELPTGVVTFLLTDIEGSSGLWEADPGAMAAALELHDGLIEGSVDEHGGHLLKTKGEGDSTMSVFPRASDAVAATAHLCERLAEAAWPAGARPRVRIAVHTGEAYERDGDYFGPALSRAARLRALAGAEAPLVSQATAELVRERLPVGTELHDRGLQELRGLSRPEQVYALAGAVPAEAERGTRKIVTVLFAGLVETDPQARAADPEARRGADVRLLDELRGVLERHGASVEPYPGEALMAVFGVPVLHEDDALRAVTAAGELQDLMAGLDGAHGVRIGIATGEVLAGAGDGVLASGAAVTAAKRLEEAAAPGALLLDDATPRLARGRSSSVRSPLVGRARQLEALRGAFDAAVGGRSAHLVTLLGAAGVGKSRLVEELIESLGERATVLRCRCLPYGESITYWPLAELVRDLESEESAAPLADAIAADRPAAATTEKIFWETRTLLETVARRWPLVVVVDDLQWAEPTFLDLLEHVAGLARDAPLVLLCMARPELLDDRPGWGGGRLNATSLLLEPLGVADTAELLGNLVAGPATLPGEAVERIMGVCEGNPLFAEELLAILLEDGALRRQGERWILSDGPLPVPPTVHALVAARLERLPGEERVLLARASVEGTVFHREAMRELAPPALVALVDRSVEALARKDVVVPDRSSFPGDVAFRFRHMLIRDAAYGSLPKATRAELHQRFAGWLESAAAPRIHELEEIVGYHLERAHRCLVELGEADAEVAGRASERLESAGRRALRRSDRAAGIRLLERAAALVPDEPARLAALLPDLGAALIEAGRLGEAGETLAAADVAAGAAGDAVAAAHTGVQREFLMLQRGESPGTRRTAAVVDEAMLSFEAAADERGLCQAFRLRAWGHWIEGQAGRAADSWDEAATHARAAGAERERAEILGWIASSLLFGPVPVPMGIERCEAILAEVEGNPPARADVLQPLAGLHAMSGRFARARELLAASRAIFAELGLTLDSAVSHHAAMVELLAGDPAAAERSLRAGYETLEAMGDTALLSTTAGFLGQALVAAGREEEAGSAAELSAELAAPDDLVTQVLWRSAGARSLARRGQTDEAEQLAREAVALAEATDFVSQRADALVDLAAVLRECRRDAEASSALTEALALYERKGNGVAAARTSAALAAATQV